MAKIYDRVVNTYEEGGRTPVVTHIFHGKSPKQSAAFCRAHLKSDKFFYDCSKAGGGHFGKMVCRNKFVGVFPREAAPGELEAIDTSELSKRLLGTGLIVAGGYAGSRTGNGMQGAVIGAMLGATAAYLLTEAGGA